MARDYKKVFCAGMRHRGKFFLIICNPNENQGPKLGLAISKKYCRLAVQRNKIKRIIRESFRKNKDKLKGFDIVVLNNKLTHLTSSKELCSDLNAQWNEIKKD